MFQARVFRSRWRATAGVALVVLFPTLPPPLVAHADARPRRRTSPVLLGLFLLLPVGTGGRSRTRSRRGRRSRRSASQARFVRTRSSICSPALCVAAVRWYRERARPVAIARALAAGVLGVVLGLAPFTRLLLGGHREPLPSDARDGDRAVPLDVGAVHRRRPRHPAARASASRPAPGGVAPRRRFRAAASASRISGARYQGTSRLLRDAYGDVFLLAAIVGAMIALGSAPHPLSATVPYCVLALIFFSFWGRPDTRYLVGVFLLLPMLIVEGTLGAARPRAAPGSPQSAPGGAWPRRRRSRRPLVGRVDAAAPSPGAPSRPSR